MKFAEISSVNCHFLTRCPSIQERVESTAVDIGGSMHAAISMSPNHGAASVPAGVVVSRAASISFKSLSPNV